MALNTKRGILNLDNVAIFLAELFGTGMLVFFSCSSCIKWDTNSQLDTLQIVLTVGFSVLLAVQTFGCISGGHINPCVTIGAVILNVISFQVTYAFIFIKFSVILLFISMLWILSFSKWQQFIQLLTLKKIVSGYFYSEFKFKWCVNFQKKRKEKKRKNIYQFFCDKSWFYV